MKRLLLLTVVLAALLGPAAAWAHPLGNFTINRYSRIAPSGDRVYVLYVLDMAEIPTFQQRTTIRAAGEAAFARTMVARITRSLVLRIDGRRTALRPLRHALAFPKGQAGLHTLRLEVVYATGALSGRLHDLDYRDGNFAGRIGWKEIVVQAGAGARVESASVPSRSVSEELRAYPKDLLQSPLDVAEARAELAPGSGPGVAPSILSGSELQAPAAVRAVAGSGFAKLISKDRLSVGFVLVALLVAFFWGAAHALSPGHGKSIVAAYLVGSRGTARHAVLLGLTVTITHTIGVFTLGLVTLTLSEFIVPDQLYPWLNLVSALLIVAVGISVLRWRLREWRRGPDGNDHHVHDHDHHHHHHGDHHHYHGHDHAHPEPALEAALSTRSLLAVGISGGIIPCPTALVVLLAAISLHRLGYGLVLIVAFSVGLAATVTAIGLLAVTAKRTFRRVNLEGGLLRLLPAASALVVLGLGIAMTVRALPKIT